jgi:Ala-tRNA(Pro) deacylase
MKLDEFLLNQGISFERLRHRTAYTASRMAQVLHVPGKEVAKTVLLRAGRGYALAVLPATHRVDLEQIRGNFRRGTGGDGH